MELPSAKWVTDGMVLCSAERSWMKTWIWESLAYRTVVLERTPESLLDSKEIKSISILREINPEYSLEGLMVKLKLQYFGHLMRTGDLLEKFLMLGKIEGRRQRGHQWMRWLDSITNSMENELGQTLGDGEGQGGLACCSLWDRNELDTTGLLNSNNNKHIENCY